MITFIVERPDKSYGFANGYVAIPPSHPLFGQKYPDIDVHGGVTLSEPASADIAWMPDYVPKDYWVFGFDTAHDHYEKTRWPDADSVMKEVDSMAAQLVDKESLFDQLYLRMK